MIPARTLPCRAAYSNVSGLSSSVTGTTVVERMRLNKDCKGSRGVFKCVRHSTNMDGPGMSGQTLSVEKILGVLNYTTSQYQHGWTITMDERLNFLSVEKTLETIVE
ncbi:hypothetical protein TNCV_2748321 [Trichonephila clavipes]|nr:hypothetical protein TNCV_2748321 [Trichonephila clavipes]